MRRASIVLCFACQLFQPVDAFAQLGTITGVITDAGTSAQIAGDVHAYTANGLLAQTTGIIAGSPTTPYQIVGLQPGTYFLLASSAGYVPELPGDIACVAADCSVTAGTPVVVTAGGVTTVDFALARAGSFTGTVRRASNGTGLPGLAIFVYNASTSRVTSVVTGAGGTYTVPGLAAGSYFAGVNVFEGAAPRDYLSELYGGVVCPSVECLSTFGAPIAVTNGATTPGIDFSLDQGGTISGTVVADGTSAPLNASVQAFAGDVAIAQVGTDANGQYSIVGLPPGAYRVRASTQATYVDEWFGDVCVGCPGTPTPVAVAAGGTVGGINFSLAAGGTISGTVTCEVLAPSDFNAGPQIYAFNSSGTLVRSSQLLSGTCATYTIAGLPAGQYYVLARDTPRIPFGTSTYGGVFIDKLYGDVVCMTIDCDVRRGTPVTVALGQTTAGVDFNMKQGVASPLVTTTDGPLRMFDSRGVELVSAVRTGFTFTQQAIGLPPGTYFARLGDRLHGRGLCFDCSPTSGRPIVIGPEGGIIAFDFGPAVTSPRISGTVRDAAGSAPLSTITIELYSPLGRLLSTATSDVIGTYVIKDPHSAVAPVTIAPGSYYLRTRNNRGYVDEVYPGVVCADCDVRIGTPVVVGTTDVSSIDFTIAAGGVVGGTVTDAGGVALGGVPVSLFNATGTLAGQAVANSGGYFGATLPPGSYRARAEPTASHGAEVFNEQPCTSGACDVTGGTPIAVTAGALLTNINFTLASCSAMTLSPPLLASGAVGSTYRQVFSTSGGVGPYVYRVSTGALPAGVTLATSSGVLDGTATVAGRHTFTVGVVDANGCATSRAYTLDVQDCAFTLSPASATVPAVGGTITVAIAGACGSQTVTALTFVSVLSNTTGQVVLDVLANTGAAARTDDITIGRRVFSVRQAGLASQPPFGAVDTPIDGAQVSGSIAVGGWALDDLEASRVQIFRDPVGGEPPMQVFIGTAVFIAGARPDIQRAYPTYPQNDRAGWGYLILTNMLPNQGNGTFRIYAYADDAEGARVLLGARNIVVNNATTTLPFGAIDTPAQGETVAGSAYLNWGWALTPQPKIIPTDGSTIQVLVDGVPMGNPTYNLFRSDVSGLFPRLANSGGPVGYRVLDTTALAEGQHTIAWIVTDSLGAATGIGSRYFSVANSADAQASVLGSPGVGSTSTEAFAPVARDQSVPSIAVVAGPDSGRRAASLSKAAVTDAEVIAHRAERPARPLLANDGRPRTLKINALERLQLTLGESDDACAGSWAGYLVAGDTLTDLPVGSAIDPTGTFYWQPGPAFAGTFELLFVRTACDGSKKRLPVTVTIETR